MFPHKYLEAKFFKLKHLQQAHILIWTYFATLRMEKPPRNDKILLKKYTQLTFNCLKSTREILRKGVKYVQS